MKLFLQRFYALPWLLALIFISCQATAPASRADQPGKSASKENPAERAAAALYEGIRIETLPNGMHIYLKPIPGAPVVTSMVAYKVGAADEDLDHTGLSHYLEHLMFKGTDKIMPGDIDRLTLRNGGANNAYTSEDYTIFHFDFAADRWEAALKVEADRMRNLRIDTRHEFEPEKGAVIAELESNEDQPWDLETKAILPLLFDRGPYGHPVIGERSHVREATAKIIKSHYDKWYYPNNASLVITGGFDPDRAMAKIQELFGPLPMGKLPERKTEPSFKRQGPIKKEIPSKFESPRMLMGYNGVRSGDPDYYTLEVIQALLTGGKTGRLYRRLVEQEQLSPFVECTNYSGRYPGWFEFQVEVLKGKDRTKVETIVLEELKKLRDKPVDAAELQRVQRGLVSNAIFTRESVHGLADSIARGVTTNDLDFLKGYLPRIQAVTAQQVQEAARKYFDPEQRVVVWSIPGLRRDENQGSGPSRNSTRINADSADLRGSLFRLISADPFNPPPAFGPAIDKDSGQTRTPKNRPAFHSPAASAGEASFSLKDARRVELPNGLVLLLLENHRLPIVVAGAAVRWTSLLEPPDKAGVAALTASLLDEGTTRHTGPEIAELIENVGGSLSFSENGAALKVLSPDRSLGLGLLFECLSEANFPQEAFSRKQAQQLASIDDAERQPDAKAQMVYRRLAYGKHPYGRPSLGRRPTVEALKPADCLEFYRKVFVPNNTTVAIVGDFDTQQVIDEVTRLTADWKKAPLEKPKTPVVAKPPQFVEQIVTMPEAAQLHFFMGHAGIRRNNPDYYKLLVMDYVLGTGPGFTDRLSAKLRDREGLAYTVSASITNSAGEEPGLFTCYIGTAPDFLPRVKQLFGEELARIRAEKPADQEVEDAKKYLLGSLPFQLTTNERIASMLLTIERYRLGLDYLDEYKKAVAAVTADDVHAVAQKYIDPEHMILVVAGAVDKTGKPLHPLPQPKK
jgi:zinc protease